MKTTRKLLLALVLVMSILMTLAVAVIPASAASANTKVAITGGWNSWSQNDNTNFIDGYHVAVLTLKAQTYDSGQRRQDVGH